jgi:hypothetical protein
MKGALKIGIALALLGAAAAFLLIAAEGARDRGRVTWCRNNLRKLGTMGYDKLETDPSREATGRAFWQDVRRANYTSERGGVETWIIRQGGANPFGCPVRGVQPRDLTTLSKADFEKHMSDPATIDYRGPRNAPPMESNRPEVLGGDLDGNHGGRGGHILLVDLSVRDVRTGLQILTFRDAGGAGAGLTD